MSDPRVTRARELMAAFAERTGLSSDRPDRRYLWTDAFAACNFFGLGDPQMAATTIDRVHRALGRHRDDDPRTGWISGLDEAGGAARPTCAGLRIGKKLPERRAGEPPDERLEWDRDGQYFHYLTRWMHALDVAARRTGDERYHRWSIDLAEAAFAGFVGGGRMRGWKMSVDLSRPQVEQTGQMDPLDGVITYGQLADTARAFDSGSSLDPMIREFAAMLGPHIAATADPLGIGGLLAGAYRLEQIGAFGPLVPILLAAAGAGLEAFTRGPALRGDASQRLAFRELGLAIGLAAVARMDAGATLARRVDLGEAITDFWLDPAHQRAATWREHLDINAVMLATSLAPDGYLELPALDRRARATPGGP